MDSFELNWPATQATLYTDGCRLKIVVRDKRGPSGTVTNNDLCKKRVAMGLDFAPDLIERLKSRGHVELAAEIEGQAAVSVAAPAAIDVVAVWLDELEGSREWAECKNKRAKVWHTVAADHFLKAPLKRGKQEWVVKSTVGGTQSFLTAPEFRGICCALAEQGEAFVETFLAGCAELAAEHPSVEHAIRAWRKPKG